MLGFGCTRVERRDLRVRRRIEGDLRDVEEVDEVVVVGEVDVRVSM